MIASLLSSESSPDVSVALLFNGFSMNFLFFLAFGGEGLKCTQYFTMDFTREPQFPEDIFGLLPHGGGGHVRALWENHETHSNCPWPLITLREIKMETYTLHEPVAEH